MDVSSPMTVLVKAREGDEDAFAALVQQHSHRIFQLAYRMTRNEQDAEDIVQESFLKAYKQLGHFQAKADFGTWLYRITANCAIDNMRTRQQRIKKVSEPIDEAVAPLTSDVPGPERLAAGAEMSSVIDGALGDLTPIERAAFTLRHHEGRSIEEICDVLNLGKSAAKHAVFRAVKKLRTVLAPLSGRAKEIES
jgi:RNA polymerase sigma-70 factor (ECF subfamily)